MQPSDVSAFRNLQSATDVSSSKRAEAGVNNSSGHASAHSARLDTTSVSAGARALTFHKQAEIVSQNLSAERIARLREQRPQPERIAEAILRAEFDA